jgi:formylglycine-generating enzyme required for sulfatase activity
VNLKLCISGSAAVVFFASAAQTFSADKVNFEKDVRPILELTCLRCHGAEHPKGGLRLDTRANALKGGDTAPAIVPGNPDKSPLYTSTILPADADGAMPPKGDRLKKPATDTLKDWIAQGAEWPENFVLIAKKVEAPVVDQTQVDAQIHEKILAHLNVKAEGEMKPYKETIGGTGVSFEMLPIPSGKFTMGSPEGEKGRKPDEGPQHEVKIEPFWMAKCEITWNEYELFNFPDAERKKRVMAKYDATQDAAADAVTRPTTPYVEMSFGMGKDGYPAISMTQHAANTYCKWLSAKTGNFYRLPTEAEWEYACRAGTTTAYSFGDDAAQLGDYAWYTDNSDGKYQKVGTKKPNPWGLYDMHGNVVEWTLDQYDPDTYKQFVGKVVEEPWIKATTPYPHSVRGGSWDDSPEALRSAARRGSNKSWKMQDPQLPKSIWYHTDAQFLGFRIIRPLKVPSAEELSKYWTSGVQKD